MLLLKVSLLSSARTLISALLYSLVLTLAAHAATVYMWRDDTGTKQYSDYCPQNRKCVSKETGGAQSGGKDNKGKSQQSTTTTSTDTQDTSTADTGTPTSTTTTTTTTPTTSTTYGEASLAWDAVTHPNLAGYRIYYAMAGTYYQVPGQGIDAGRSTTFNVTGLAGGARYYFKVSAYDSSGSESGYSNEVYKDIR